MTVITITCPDTCNASTSASLGAFNVRDYGAKGDGTTDDTAAIQVALNAAKAVPTQPWGPGSHVYFPPGKYLVSSTLVVQGNGVALQGAGSLVSMIYRKTDYGDTIKVAPVDITQPIFQAGNHIKGLTFQHDGLVTPATHGAHLDYTACTRFVIDDVACLEHFGGILFTSVGGGMAVCLSNLQIYSGFGAWATKQAGSFLMKFSEDATVMGYKPNGPIFVSNFDFEGANHLIDIGVQVQSADGIWFTNGHIGNVEVAEMDIQPQGSGSTVQSVICNNVYLDGFWTGSHGLRMLPMTGGQIKNVQCSNSQFKNHGGSNKGMYCDPGANGRSFTFTGCEFADNGGQGADVRSGLDWRFSGCTFRNNNKSNVGAAQFVSVNLKLASFTGNFVGTMDAGNFPATGLSLTGTTDQVVVTGTTFNGNVADMDGQTGWTAKVIVANNVPS